MTHAVTQAEVEKVVSEAHGGTVWAKWTMILAMAERINKLVGALESISNDDSAFQDNRYVRTAREALADYRGSTTGGDV